MFGVSDYWIAKYERDARKNWDLFYKRNEGRAYNDRHWILNSEEDDGFGSYLSQTDPGKTVLEVGCGVGNTVSPLLQHGSSIFVHAFDFSPRAIDLLKFSTSFNSSRCNAFVHDITADDIPHQAVPEHSVDVALLLFVLSAIDPASHLRVLQRIRRTLRPGGLLLFRDFQRGDLAELRFKSSSQIGQNYFVRQDGTRSFFFGRDELARLAGDAGFESNQIRSVEREITNRRQNTNFSRSWLQGVFRAE